MSRKSKNTVGEQMDLIEVGPEHKNEIIACAKRYAAAQTARLKALEAETTEKQALLELVKAEHLSSMEGGKIKLRCDDFLITITPRDELVQVKEDLQD